jgi:hypothetical protein
MPGGAGRIEGDAKGPSLDPQDGEPAVLAETLRDFAREGIAHVQLVLDPNTRESIAAVAPVLDELDRIG